MTSLSPERETELTPMMRACLEMGSCDDPVDMKLTRAVVSAYLQAIAEDAETVERVARALYEKENRAMQGWTWEKEGADKTLRAYWLESAKAALLTLSTISGGEKG